jgi:hypothetical protein
VAVTVADVKARLTEFCDVDPDKLTAALAQADGCINRPQWGENRADEATIYLTGHFLIFMAEGSDLAPGAKTSESEGQLSAAYAVNKGAQESVYGSTSYGRHYLELRRTAWPERF